MLERDRADRAMKESPRKSFSSSNAPQMPHLPRQYSDSKIRTGNKKSRASQILPNGLTVETINVARDEKEARSRAKATARGRRISSQSPTDGKSFAPSIKSFNPSLMSGGLSNTDTSDGPPTPWLQDQRRRFSSPLMSHKFRGSTDNLNTSSGRGGNGSSTDLRMSTQSMMVPPQPAFSMHGNNQPRSASPSRQSFMTSGTSPRESKGWRRSFWNRSASASVLSFAHSGSMMEMHLGMSQDKHQAVPLHAAGYPQAANGVWPDNSSAMEESGGISPDDNVEAAITKEKKKKKGFKKFLNSLIGNHASSNSSDRRAATDGGTIPRPDNQEFGRRQSGLSYTAATANPVYQEDFSEPLAPPPPLSFLTGQPPHRRSVSSSSQSSASPVLPINDYYGQNGSGRPNSLAVPGNNASSNGYISPSTSSSDLNRNRPSSVTSWRSSSKTGSPQSPREVVAESFGSPMPALRRSGPESTPMYARLPAGVDTSRVSEQPAELSRLRREKSLPALPPPELGESTSASPIPPSTYSARGQQVPLGSRSSKADGDNRSISYQYQDNYSAPRDSYTQSMYSTYQGEDRQYGTEYEDYDTKQTRKTKSKSKLLNFGGRKGSRGEGGSKNSDSPTSSSPPPATLGGMPSPRLETYTKDFAPREVALQAVVRDDPTEMVAYR